MEGVMDEGTNRGMEWTDDTSNHTTCFSSTMKDLNTDGRGHFKDDSAPSTARGLTE